MRRPSRHAGRGPGPAARLGLQVLRRAGRPAAGAARHGRRPARARRWSAWRSRSRRTRRRSLERSLEAFLAALPGWLDPVWGFLADLLWLWALVLVASRSCASAWSSSRRRWRRSCSPRCSRSGRPASRSAPGRHSRPVFGTAERTASPTPRVAEAMAVIVTVAPHLARPVRALGRWLLAARRARRGRDRTPLGTFAAAAIARRRRGGGPARVGHVGRAAGPGRRRGRSRRARHPAARARGGRAAGRRGLPRARRRRARAAAAGQGLRPRRLRHAARRPALAPALVPRRRACRSGSAGWRPPSTRRS